jgi:basic membrane protein A
LSRVAPDFPGTRFVVAQADLALPEVQSIHYEEHQGSSVAGVLAAPVTEKERFGFVGG